MKALILAGGYGTRLKEIGEQLPKGLIQFGQTNLITHVVEELQSLHVLQIAVVTNAKYFDQYRMWASNQKSIQLINDLSTSPETRLGALGDLKFAIESLGWTNEDVLVAPSDTYFAFSLSQFVDTTKERPNNFATIVREMDKADIKNRLGCAVLNESNQITDFVEKPDNPPSPYAAIPFYYYPAQIHGLLSDYMAEGNSMDAPGNIIPWLLKRSLPVHACIVTDKTIDVGTPTELELLKSV